jgi:hypothetical protein
MQAIRKIRLQPKQAELLRLVEESPADWIGVWGGRGCAKSFGLDAIQIVLALTHPGFLGCIVMRNHDQVRKYHIEPMMRQYPELAAGLKKTDSHLKLGQGSQIDFSYAECYDDVERRFRSGNYHVIAVDQAEQFMEPELREMKKAARVGLGKMLLSLNMGGAGIQILRQWFHTHEVGERETPAMFTGIHVFTWDNIEWSRVALAEDGLTEEDYYSWSNEQRMEYCGTRTIYGRSLNSEDDALRNRDWLGSWESLEGAYFGRVFDRAATLLTPDQVRRLIKPWDQRWISTDWGKTHFCVSHWHAETLVSVDEALEVLGWEVKQPFKACVTYREDITNEMSSPDVGKRLVDKTPEIERHGIKRYYLSPDAFGERDSANTTADNLTKEFRRYGMPNADPADNEVAGGCMLMYNLMAETKRHASTGGEVWLISGNCPQLLESIPLAMSDMKDLDRITKTDKSRADVNADTLDSARYGLKSKLSPGVKPKRVALEEELSQKSGMARLQTIMTFDRKWDKTHPGKQRVRRYR